MPTAAPRRTWRRLAAAVHPNVVLTYIDILLRLRSSVTPDKLLGTLLYYYISSDQSTLRPQFYIQLVYTLQATFWNMNSSVWVIWVAQGSKEKNNLSMSLFMSII